MEKFKRGSTAGEEGLKASTSSSCSTSFSALLAEGSFDMATLPELLGPVVSKHRLGGPRPRSGPDICLWKKRPLPLPWPQRTGQVVPALVPPGCLCPSPAVCTTWSTQTPQGQDVRRSDMSPPKRLCGQISNISM